MSEFGWPYLRNQWYAAVWAEEIGRDLHELWLMDTPLVLYRTEAGEPVALDNRCLHHRYPLSRGYLKGDQVVCGYHGFTYAADGRCVRIPGQESVPQNACLRSFPIIERYRWLWIWMGDPELVDEAKIPDFHWLNDPEWVPVGGTLELAARYELLNENLLDLSHVEFIHKGSIGATDLSQYPIETSVAGDKVQVKRIMKNIEASPLFTKTMGLKGEIDRWQIEEWSPPCYHVVHVGATSPGADLSNGCEYKVLNAIVPVRGNTSRYLWAVSRNYARDQEWVTDYLQKAVRDVFMEDVAACEAQEEMLAISSFDNPELLAKVDNGVVSARRVMKRLKREEEAAQANAIKG